MIRFKMFGAALLTLGSALVINVAQGTVRAGNINAVNAYFSTQSTSGTATVAGKKYKVTVTTIPLTYYTYCPWIANGMVAKNGRNPLFPNDQNVAWAGSGVASALSPVSASDFTVTNYTPWAVNNNTAVTLPDGSKLPSGEMNVDGGGAYIVESYQPTNGDPTSVNFVQGTIATLNGNYVTPPGVAPGATPSGGMIDANPNLTPLSPFYNVSGAAGTGTTYRGGEPNDNGSITAGTSPLVTQVNPKVPAWMGDAPALLPTQGSTYTYTQTFQAFIESTQMISGTKYDVMYGGVQWGYTVTSVLIPAPEPGTFTLAILGGVGVIILLRKSPRAAAILGTPR